MPVVWKLMNREQSMTFKMAHDRFIPLGNECLPFEHGLDLVTCVQWKKHSKSIWMAFPRLSCKKLWLPSCFHFCSDEASCHVMSCRVKRPTWKGTKVVYIHNEILLSNKKECICISSNEVDETGAYYTEWSKPERKTPIQYTNAYIWNLERW